MRVKRLLHKLLVNTNHEKRIAVIGEVVETMLHAKSSSVTQLGRRLKNKCQTRSNIRKVDRLYSNAKLVLEKAVIYKEINALIINTNEPQLSVDASKLPNSNYYTLRATLAASGRGLTVYELVYERSIQGSTKLYKRFLSGLSSVLPEGCTPILVSDAEFRGPWFNLVLKKRWDFVGRARGIRNVSFDGNTWAKLTTLHSQATGKAASLGLGELTKRSSLLGYFYLYRGRAKNRHAYTRSGRHSETDKSKKHAKSSREPWVLFSSLDRPAKEIINIYRRRMTIEENFRDSKSGRYGFGLEMTRSKQKGRYIVMLLLAMIASCIAYLIGCSGETKGLHRKFQANSIKHKRILSRFFLGCEMFYRGYRVPWKDFTEAIKITAAEVALLEA